MGAEADELKPALAGLAINENKVGSDVAIAMIIPFARQRVFEVAAKRAGLSAGRGK